MIKQEINSLSFTDGSNTVESVLPFSYLNAKGAWGEGGVHYGTNLKEVNNPDSLTVYADFAPVPTVTAHEFLEMRMTNLGAPVTVELNGRVVGKTDTALPYCSFNVRDALTEGKNKLKITFDGAGFVPSVYCLSPFSLNSITLVAFNRASIGTVLVKSEAVDNNLVRLYVELKDVVAEGGVRAVCTLVSPGGRVYFVGMVGGRGAIDISAPNLWWPRGLGVQNLYKLTVNLYYENEIIDSRDISVGLSHYSTRQGSDPLGNLQIHGVPIFSRGACYFATDALSMVTDENNARKLLGRLVDARFNTIVIRDSGVYPLDSFYSLCDTFGITVWHEVELSGDIEKKTEKVKRGLLPKLYHPSVAFTVFTGGAPTDELIAMLSQKPFAAVDYLDDYTLTLPTTIPSPSTLSRFVPKGEWDIFSPTLEARTALTDNAEMISSTEYRFPSGLSQVGYVQAMRALDTLIAYANSCRMYGTVQGRIILSCLCDSLPMLSPSLFDALNLPKPAYFTVRRVFSDIYISAVKHGTRVTFFASNATRNDYFGNFSYSVLNSFGKVNFQDGFEITVPKLTQCEILTVELDEAVEKLNASLVTYKLTEGFSTSSQGTLLFTSAKEFEFEDPKITKNLSGSGTDFTLSLSADLAVRVLVEAEGVAAEFSDNLVDLSLGSVKNIIVKTSHPVAIEALRSKITVTTLYDLSKK